MNTHKSPLHQMAETTITDYWNDSCTERELSYALEHGAVGATSNPVIVLAALKEELPQWEPTIRRVIAHDPLATEDEIAWNIIETVASTRAKFLNEVFLQHHGTKGRLSIQTNPKFFSNSEKLIAQALHFNSLYPNNNIKIPATEAGMEAIEEVTAQGISINATVSFSVPQALAVAEAVEKGLKRYTKNGGDSNSMAPVCTIMVGRADDWMKQVVKREKKILNPEWLEWAGVAIMKNAYKIYQERKYRTRLLAAAFRNHYHWSQFIGADMVITIPCPWARRINSSAITVKERIDDEVDPRYIQGLRDNIPDFVQAFDAEGMTIQEFDTFGATRRTLRQFLTGYSELVNLAREYRVPNPDI